MWIGHTVISESRVLLHCPVQGRSLFLFWYFLYCRLIHTDALFIPLAPRVLPCRCLQHAQKPVLALRSRVLASIVWRKDWNTDEILGAHPGIRLAQSICHAPNTIGLIMGHHFHSFQNPRVGGLWGQILKQLHNLPSRGPLTIQLLALVKICSPAIFRFQDALLRAALNKENKTKATSSNAI